MTSRTPQWRACSSSSSTPGHPQALCQKASTRSTSDARYAPHEHISCLLDTSKSWYHQGLTRLSRNVHAVFAGAAHAGSRRHSWQRGMVQQARERMECCGAAAGAWSRHNCREEGLGAPQVGLHRVSWCAAPAAPAATAPAFQPTSLSHNLTTRLWRMCLQ